jgi:N-acetylglucosaminyl-diphospho-decaprenol L-rhamnosyltransferase
MRQAVSAQKQPQDATIDCSIVIVHYRSEARLGACLGGLPQAAADLRYEVIVVDNSRSLAANGIMARHSGLRLIENAANVGFARAANQGAGLAAGRNLLFINPDATAQPGSIARLARYLDEHPDAGAVGPRLNDPDGRLQYSCRRFPGLLTVFFGRYAVLSRVFPGNKYSNDYLYLAWDHGEERDVDWLSGACLMVRRGVFDAIAGFDARYFLFVEDMDLCRRIRNEGRRVVYLPDAVVTHEVGVSRDPRTARVIWARHRGMWRYFRQHFRGQWLLSPLVAGALLLRAVLLIVALGLRRMFFP